MHNILCIRDRVFIQATHPGAEAYDLTHLRRDDLQIDRLERVRSEVGEGSGALTHDSVA